jgi:hypothetical protein
MDMLKMEGIDMVEEQDHPTNHRLGEEGMNMVKVDDMDTMDGHFHLMNHRLEMEDMDTVDEHFHPMNHRLEVEGMDMADTDMGEDRAAELEVVEREPKCVMLVIHWNGEASPNSSGVGGACKTGVFKRSIHVCNSGLQL